MPVHRYYPNRRADTVLSVVRRQQGNVRDGEDMELILEEFVTVTTEHVDPDDVNAMDRMLDGWVAIEDTEFTRGNKD